MNLLECNGKNNNKKNKNKCYILYKRTRYDFMLSVKIKCHILPLHMLLNNIKSSPCLFKGRDGTMVPLSFIAYLIKASEIKEN